MKTKHAFEELVVNLLIFCIMGLRPLMGPRGVCKYPVTCTAFAIQKLQSENFFNAVSSIFFRIVTCISFF